MLNGAPLNAAPLNGFSGSSTPAIIPQPIVPGLAFRWKVRVTVAGVDMSARLTGQIEVDRERGAAGVASFTLNMPPGQVLPMDWVGREVKIDYITTAGGVTAERRRYTGRVITTDWSPLTRQLTCQCGDQLQQRIEKLAVADVDALIPSAWSADVFEAAEGRSRWDYAQERLGTVQASLDSSAEGDLRLSTWYATANENFAFGRGTTIYNTVKLSYADLTSLSNTVEIEAQYRFNRLHQLNETFFWVHPDTGGSGGMGGFCRWRPDSSELPDVAMVKESASSAGLSITAEPAYARVPLSTPDPCGNGQPWVNNYADLLLGVTFTGGRRWTQAVTETYTLTVVAENSVAQAGEVIQRESVSIDYTNDLADNWESTAFGIDATPPTLGSETGHTDQRDEPQRQAALNCLLNQAKTTIIEAHSGTVISWDVPTSMVLDVDLPHTLLLDDQGIKARARCSRVLDTFDLAAGTAITTLAITVMRGGGVMSDPLLPPAPSAVPQAETGDPVNLPTQLGGKSSSPDYDEELDGFSGNYDNADPTYPVFDRRFQITASEIAEDQRDEQEVAILATYRVAVPDDLLEL